MIGKIEALLDQRVNINYRCSPEPWRECNNMFLTIESARSPCCTTLSRLPCNMSAISLISARSLLSRLAPRKGLPQFVYEFDRDGRKIVDEIERIFDFVCNAGCQLT